MRLNFRTYHENTLLTEGTADYTIPHLEDLDVETFIRVLENLHELEAVQKLDGANLRVGLDERGDLYTSREQKGGKRFYSESDFPKSSVYDGFRTAHAVLEKAEGYFMQVLVPGESINLEILFGPQPNTVLYGKDNLNYIALLEMLPGDDPSVEPDQGKIKELMKLLDDKQFVVRTAISDTVDGVTIVKTPTVTPWKFTTSDVVPRSEISKISFVKELGAMKAYLRQENQVARDQGHDLTNFEVLKDRSRDLTQERQEIQNKLMNDFKLPIKKKLMGIVYKQKPSLRGIEGDDATYNGIEGIIFKDPKTGEKFKIVDKDVFTAVNKFNYQARKAVASRVTSADPNMSIEARGGIVGEARTRSIKLLGIEGAETPSQTKKALLKFQADTREDTIEAIARSLNQLNFGAVRRKLQAIYISAIDDLEEALNTFKMNGSEYSLNLKDGQTVKYTKEIRRRTLLIFAEARRGLIETLHRIQRSSDMYDLIEVMFKDQLDQLFGA